MKRLFFFLLLGGFFAPAVRAQIYAGLSSSGSIVLSSDADETANAVLIAAQLPAAGRSTRQDESAGAAIPAAYLPFILEAAQTYALPSELIHALILVESNYNPRALSTRGA